jgi:oligosaccharide repeat unit polymerase
MAFFLLGISFLLIGYGLLFISRDYLSPLALYSYFATLAFPTRATLLLFGLDDFFSPSLLYKDMEPLIEQALLVFIVAHVAILMGYIGLGGTAKRLQNLIPRMPGEFDDARLSLVAVVLSGITLFAAASVMLESGSVGSSVVMSRAPERNNILNHVPQFTISFLAIAAAACAIAKRSRMFTFVGALFLFTLALNVPFGDRSAMLIPFIVAALARHLSGRRVHKGILAGLFVGVIVASAAMGEIRTSLLQSRGDTTEIAELYGEDRSGIGRTMTKGLNIQTLDYFIVVLQDFDYHNFLWGEHFINGAAGVVPRAIWPSKPENISPGQWFRSRYVPNGKAGRPFTVQGVYWVNFGTAGVFVGYFLAGILLRTVAEHIKRNRSTLGGGFAGLCSLFLLNSGIAPTFPVILVKWILPYMIVVAFISGGLRARQSAAPGIAPALTD